MTIRIAVVAALCIVAACSGAMTPPPRQAPDRGTPEPRPRQTEPRQPTDLAASITRGAVGLGRVTALDSAGLAAFGSAIGDARIVMLGEAWHGDGGAIRLRAELVKYLHRHHGFDVLVFEADFYGLHLGWQEAMATGDVSRAAANVYSFWSEVPAATPLWDYIAEALSSGDTLHVAGMDPKMHGAISRGGLADSLHARLRRHTDATPADAASAAGVLRGALSPGPPTANALTPNAFDGLVRHVSALQEALRGEPDEAFWGQAAASIRSNITGQSRDAGMAENLIWLATHQYPGRKIIVWAHNNHILTDKWAFFDAPDPQVREMVAGLTEQAIGTSTFTGAEARRFFGDRLYSVATIPYSGQYSTDIGPALNSQSADFDRLAELEPAPPGTVEHALAALDFDVAFADLRRLRGSRAASASRILDYSQTPPLALRLQDGWDGLLFLRSTAGLNETQR